MSSISRIRQAFSEDQAARLARVSLGQIRYWDKSDFFAPSIAYENRRSSYSRIYSFDDVVGLRVLGELRNTYNVSLQHLRRVRDRLSSDQNIWANEIVYVKDKQVYFRNELGNFKNGETGEDTLPNIPIRRVMADVEEEASHLRFRKPTGVGKIIKQTNIAKKNEVFEGTRIPVTVVEEYLSEGYKIGDVLKDYPTLKRKDIDAAIEFLGIEAA